MLLLEGEKEEDSGDDCDYVYGYACDIRTALCLQFIQISLSEVRHFI
jgi:hypothetical protein